MSNNNGQPVFILKEGSSETKGKEAQKNNIFAATLVAQLVKTSLGPRGMDKMLVDGLGDVTITNDGATILKEIDMQHPAGKMMVEVAKTTDNEVGDGTTTSVVLSGALLEKAQELIDKEVHPTMVIDGYARAAEQALEILKKIAIKVDKNNRDVLINQLKCLVFDSFVKVCAKLVLSLTPAKTAEGSILFSILAIFLTPCQSTNASTDYYPEYQQP